MQVYEFNGKKYKVSERNSSDVKVGDVVKIVFPTGASEWHSEAMKMVGNVYLVKDVRRNDFIYVEHEYSFAFTLNEFIIMEEEISPVKISRNHPHAEMIRQWLDDASLEVEYRPHNREMWYNSISPMWEPAFEYRFKPKTVTAWQVLYEYEGSFDITHGHYKTEEEFNKRMTCNEKFIKFVLETEKQIPA